MTKFGDLDARNPLKYVFVGMIRGYQKHISPALPRSCKYHPSCSQYAIDAFTQFGVFRGLVLMVWRLLRCNPLSYGGYDPVERQTLFGDGRRRRKVESAHGRLVGCVSSSGRLLRGRGPRSLAVIALLVTLFLAMTLFTASCSFFGTTTTTAAPTTTVSGSTSTTAGATTTTTLKSNAGFLAGPLKPLQALFFWVLEQLDKLLNSWSWSIVLLTVIVRIVLVPLTWRQIKSMRAMQALQPQIKALQEKYKNDREMLNQKTMEFYRENKVNPFGSCLPLVLQLPVFFGLYYMLTTAGHALNPATAGRWAGLFLSPSTPGAPLTAVGPVGWLWIHDITQFDYFLMFLYIASQFVASWQTARKAGGQQKMIAYFMPIIIGIFMFIGKWPSGLFIYWFTSNLWTIAQQYVAEKVMPAPVSAVVAPVKAGARGAPARGRPSGTTSAKSGVTKTGPAGTTPSKATTVRPAGETGGKSSGQRTGKQGKTSGRKGQRPQRGASRPKSSR
ncbi:MAG: membrane protein insertion efficiency factor YidD [Actinobacteria bacterium]|nr:membrane protein insertion efficiency factor YidD [Actinomycetota bacterium]